MDQIVYRVDEHDKITFINSSWFMFAEDNGIHLRSSSQLVGTRLWRHVSDPTVRHFYTVFMAKVRKTGKSLMIPFRCESPNSVMFMETRIRRYKKTELEFTMRLLREEAPGTSALSEVERAKIPPLLMMCLWCKKVKATRWIRPERAVRILSLFEQPLWPLISHITCPRCESKGLSALISAD
jgi:hypothetical protein